MSTEDKIAAIRRGVALRGDNFINQLHFDIAMKSASGVVIYGVPLSEQEIQALYSAIAREHPDYDAARLMSKEAYLEEQRLGDQEALLEAGSSWVGGALVAIWEMLERGKK